jgi:hypothetical protein
VEENQRGRYYLFNLERLRMATKSNFENVFLRLKEILKPYASELIVSVDSPTCYNVDTSVVMKNRQRLYFGGVRLGKAYVSFYLMPVYCSTELYATISPELKKRMQGKSCFNFKTVDEKLFKELGRLTKKGLAKFKDKKFLASLP